MCQNRVIHMFKQIEKNPSFQNLSITDKVNITILLLHLKLLRQSNVLKEGNDNQVHSILNLWMHTICDSNTQHFYSACIDYLPQYTFDATSEFYIYFLH